MYGDNQLLSICDHQGVPRVHLACRGNDKVLVQVKKNRTVILNLEP